MENVASSSASSAPSFSSSASSALPTLEAGVSFLLKYWQSPTITLSHTTAGQSGSDGGDGDGEGDGVGVDTGGITGRGGRAMERICKMVVELKGNARWRLLRR